MIEGSKPLFYKWTQKAFLLVIKILWSNNTCTIKTFSLYAFIFQFENDCLSIITYITYNCSDTTALVSKMFAPSSLQHKFIPIKYKQLLIVYECENKTDSEW